MRLLFSSDFQAGVTETFHLFNTMRVSTHLLADEVGRLVSADASDRVLEALYPMQRGASGQNLRAFSTSGDDVREGRLASMWLLAVVGLYEVWADDLPGVDGNRGCQFPSRGTPGNPDKSGHDEAFASLESHPALEEAYGETINSDLRQLNGRIEDALALYRLYKECRNSLAHSGGLASDRVERWGRLAVSSFDDLHVDGNGAPVDMPIFVEGAPVHISFAQIRCLVANLLRLTATIDARLLVSTVGDEAIRTRWSHRLGAQPIKVSSAKLARGNWIDAQMAAIGAPTPLKPTDLIGYLESSGLVTVVP